MEMLEARRNDILVLALKGRLGATSVPSVLNHLQKRIDQGKRQLALDAAGLTYINSSPPAASVASRKTARRALRTDGAVCSSGARVSWKLPASCRYSTFSARRRKPFSTASQISAI